MFDRKRIEAKRSLEANYLKIMCAENEQTDPIAIRVIQNDRPDFLLELRTIEVNNRVELRYTLENQIALEYLNPVIGKKQFLQMYRSLLIPFVQGTDWMLDYHSFCIDMEHVYLDKNVQKASYLYIPLSSYQNSDEDILDFLGAVLNKVTITDDSQFLLKLYQCFNRKEITLGELYQMLEQELKMVSGQEKKAPESKPARVQNQPDPEPVFTPVSAPIFKNSDEPEPEQKKKGFMGFLGSKTQKMQDDSEKYEKAVEQEADAEESDVLNALFGNKKKTTKKEKGLFRKNQGEAPEKSEDSMLNEKSILEHMQAQKMQQKKNEYEYTQVDFGTEVTVIDGMTGEVSKPHLELMNTGMVGIPSRVELEFTKPQIVFGRQSSDAVQPDIAVAPHYKRVGRMHACIKREKDEWYLVDLGSANGSTLNGEPLIPNQPYRLKNQDVIGFVVADPIQYRVVIVNK